MGGVYVTYVADVDKGQWHEVTLSDWKTSSVSIFFLPLYFDAEFFNLKNAKTFCIMLQEAWWLKCVNSSNGSNNQTVSFALFVVLRIKKQGEVQILQGFSALCTYVLHHMLYVGGGFSLFDDPTWASFEVYWPLQPGATNHMNRVEVVWAAGRLTLICFDTLF